MAGRKRPKRITDTACYGGKPYTVLKWSAYDGSPPAVWVVRASDNRYVGKGWKTVADPRRAVCWEIRAAADVAATLVGGEVVDLDAVSPPLHPPPAGVEIERDRLKRLYRNHAARNRQATEADMPPAPRVMSRAEADDVLRAAAPPRRGLLARLQTLVKSRR